MLSSFCTDCFVPFRIVICGGDGTVNECLASIYKRAQEDAGIDYNDPDAKVVPFPLRICQIPTGKPYLHLNIVIMNKKNECTLVNQ